MRREWGQRVRLEIRDSERGVVSRRYEMRVENKERMGSKSSVRDSELGTLGRK